jgi:hypothetical protein
MDDAMNKLNTARDALRMLPRDDSDANRRVQLKSFRDAIPDTSLAEPGERAVSSMSSSGIFLSLCGNRVERRSSLEAGFYSWKTGGTPEFASNKDIHLDTVMAFYSYRVFDNPKYDVFDIAAGGGVYWFSSEGFETFSGVILQPIRADFHAPSRWASYPWTGKDGRAVKRLLAIPSFRWGAMLFPAGFDQGVFGPPPNPRIGSDLVPTWAVFINFQPLLPHRDFAAKPKGSAASR